MDSLSTILRSIHLRGSVLSLAELGAPWGVATRGVPRAAIFHAILEGGGELRLDGVCQPLARGDVVVITQGGAHELADSPETTARPIGELMRTTDAVPTLFVRGGAKTRILCGAFHLDHAAAESFLTLLPPLLHLPATDARLWATWIRSTLELMVGEIEERREGFDAVITRMADVLFMELLRNTSLGASKGWLAALHDPQIGRALAMVHEDPKFRWDAELLASRVGLSRSRFFARFSELVGEPPATYLARWRMNVAADLLRREDLSTALLAEAVGYGSEDAFARTFRRHLGMSPAAYRRALRATG
ncbi:MAG: AraC family transcriptional regulator [Myxococcales bacterium]|nr:AraC family transcriptional regulator [Myxococcales bacterium]